MNFRTSWLSALACMLGCTLAIPTSGNEVNFADPFDAGPSLVRLTGAAWNEEPQEEPSPFAEQPAAKPATAHTTMATPVAASCTAPLTCGCSDLCCCEPDYAWVAGVEATFFWPQFNRSFLTSAIDSSARQVEVQSNAATGSVEGGLLVAPRITLGVQGCRWGLIGRYWYASPWANGYLPAAIPFEAPGVTSFDNFRAYTFDLELQRRFWLGAWTGYGLFGVRYAMVDNDRTLGLTGLDIGESIHTTSFAGQQFGGTGVTFGFWATRPICCDSPLSYFVANRYSVLWGNGSASAQTSAVVTDINSGFGQSTDTALARAHGGDLFIAELQVGLQWDAELRCFPGRAFFRTAFEYQYWDSNAQVDVRAESFASAGGATAFTTARAGDLLFDLVGFTIGAGIMY